MKTKSKNKAIQGRRNRVHQMGPIFLYPEYDMQTNNEVRALLDRFAKVGFDYLMIPECVKVIIPSNIKKLRLCKSK